MPGEVVFLIPLAGIAAMVALGLPLVRGMVRYLERKSAGGMGADEATALRREVDDLRSRLEQVEDASGRLGELEERLDFAERLLTRQRAGAQLPNGEGRHAGDA